MSICAIENSRYLFYIKAVDQREPAFWSFDFSERGEGGTLLSAVLAIAVSAGINQTKEDSSNAAFAFAMLLLHWRRHAELG